MAQEPVPPQPLPIMGALVRPGISQAQKARRRLSHDTECGMEGRERVIATLGLAALQPKSRRWTCPHWQSRPDPASRSSLSRNQTSHLLSKIATGVQPGVAPLIVELLEVGCCADRSCPPLSRTTRWPNANQIRSIRVSPSSAKIWRALTGSLSSVDVLAATGHSAPCPSRPMRGDSNLKCCPRLSEHIDQGVQASTAFATDITTCARRHRAIGTLPIGAHWPPRRKADTAIAPGGTQERPLL